MRFPCIYHLNCFAKPLRNEEKEGALLLEADPSLLPDEVKTALEQTTSEMPGYESWEVGSAYVDAYAALDLVFSNKEH